jgi:hypothetical protein
MFILMVKINSYNSYGFSPISFFMWLCIYKNNVECMKYSSINKQNITMIDYLYYSVLLICYLILYFFASPLGFSSILCNLFSLPNIILNN